MLSPGARIVGIVAVWIDEDAGQLWLRLRLSNGNHAQTFWELRDMERFAGELEARSLPLDATMQ